MMAGNPNNWWNMQHNNIRSSSITSDDQEDETEVNPTINLLISQTHPNNSLLPPLQFLHGGSSSSSSSLLPFLVSSAEPHTQDHFPHSWSQLLMGGMGSEEEERYSDPINEYHEARRVLNEGVQLDIKQEISTQNNLQLYGNQFNNNNEDPEQDHHQVGVSNTNNRADASANWTQIIPISSPKSCITTLNTTNNNNNNSNMLDFSTNKRSLQAQNHQHAENTVNSAECNSSSTTNGGVPLPKKPRVQSSSTPPLKVRKEKLGDRITALHQLVSPFGKTDTASVLLEAIGYIRFLQGQIEALSSPYMGNNHASAKNQHVVHGERNCLFPDHPGQLLNDSCLKRRGAPNQEDNKDGSKDLKGRGLCLVPISCTQLVGSDNGADYWAQSLGGGF